MGRKKRQKTFFLTCTLPNFLEFPPSLPPSHPPLSIYHGDVLQISLVFLHHVLELLGLVLQLSAQLADLAVLSSRDLHPSSSAPSRRGPREEDLFEFVYGLHFLHLLHGECLLDLLLLVLQLNQLGLSRSQSCGTGHVTVMWWSRDQFYRSCEQMCGL